MRKSGSDASVRYFFFGTTAMLLAAYAILIRQYDEITSLQAAYAVLIVLLGLLPGMTALFDKNEFGLIPLMPLHGIFYALSFGLPVFSNKTDWLGSGENGISNALVLTIFGLIFLYFGFYASRRLFRKVTPMRTRNIPIGNQIRAAWILFGMYLSFQIFPVLKAMPSVNQLSAPLGYLSLGTLAFLYFGNQLPRLHAGFLIISVAVTLLITTLSGALAPTLLFLVFFGILFWEKRRRVPWQFMIASTLVAVLLNPVKLTYRDAAWYGDVPVSILEKGNLMVKVLIDYYGGSDVFTKVEEDSSTINRMAHVATLGYVMKMTPEPVPYWNGDSYHTLWTSFIPRVLWPDKPQATIGQEFGHRYALIGIQDLWTSINLPWLVEFYANFGTYGVLGGMFMVGLLFRFLVQKLRVPASAPMEHVLAVTVMFGLFYAESNFALMVGGILSTYIAFVVLLRLLAPGQAVVSSIRSRHFGRAKSKFRV